jgi:hypothetical protein
MESDAGDVHEYLSVPAVSEFEPGAPLDLLEAVQRAARRALLRDFWAWEMKQNVFYKRG